MCRLTLSLPVLNYCIARTMALTHSESSSSLSDEEEFFNLATAQPYMFEPCYSQEELERRRNRQEEEASQATRIPRQRGDRTKTRFWCTCDRCLCLPTETECICCHEVGASQAIVDAFDPRPDGSETELDYQQKCVTLHPDFDAHLNKGVLDTYFRSHRYNWRRFPKPRGPGGTLTNSQLRLVGYRFTLDWLLQGWYHLVQALGVIGWMGITAATVLMFSSLHGIYLPIAPKNPVNRQQLASVLCALSVFSISTCIVIFLAKLTNSSPSQPPHWSSSSTVAVFACFLEIIAWLRMVMSSAFSVIDNRSKTLKVGML